PYTPLFRSRAAADPGGQRYALRGRRGQRAGRAGPGGAAAVEPRAPGGRDAAPLRRALVRRDRRHAGHPGEDGEVPAVLGAAAARRAAARMEHGVMSARVPDDELLHRLLAGELTPAERNALTERLEADAALRARLTALESLNRVLADVPAEVPPAGLLSDVVRTIRAASPAPRPVTRSELEKGEQVMARKVMWGLGSAAVRVVAVLSSPGWPPAGGGAGGAIGAARRYQAQQIGAEDVQLGDEAAAQDFLQSEVFDAIIRDEAARKLFADAGLRAQLANADLLRALADPALADALANPELRYALTNDVVASALADADFARALTRAELRLALADQNFMLFLRNPKIML